MSDQWLSNLFAEHSQAVFKYASRRLVSAEDAEDVVLDVFTTAWRRRKDVPEITRPWLYRTAAHHIAHKQRDSARRTRLVARLTAVAPNTTDADVAERVAIQQGVQAAWPSLSDSDAEVLRLWAWEDLEPIEIAEVLQITPGAARTRLSRARDNLRARLTEEATS